MRGYYSVHSLYNLVSWPVTSRFADHPCVVSEHPAESPGGGQHYSSSPIYRGTVCSLLPSCPLRGRLRPHDTQARDPVVLPSADHHCGRDMGGV